MNVYDYFHEKLGTAAGHALDETLRDLDVLDGCGRDCIAAIDAAAVFIKHVAAAFGEEDDMVEEIRLMTAATVECFWRG